MLQFLQHLCEKILEIVYPNIFQAGLDMLNFVLNRSIPILGHFPNLNYFVFYYLIGFALGICNQLVHIHARTHTCGTW